MKKFVLFMTALVFAISISTVAMATTIEYSATNNGAGTTLGTTNYTLEFEVINDTLSEDIEWFSVLFGQTTDGWNFDNYDQFSNFLPDDWGLGPAPQPLDWFSYSFEPCAIDLPGQFNSDADFDGIAPGGSLGGFTVSFDWTGVGSYDHLYFEVGRFDGWDYEWLDDGYTELPDPGTDPVPEPGTMILLVVGLFGLGFLKKRSF